MNSQQQQQQQQLPPLPSPISAPPLSQIPEQLLNSINAQQQRVVPQNLPDPGATHFIYIHIEDPTALGKKFRYFRYRINTIDSTDFHYIFTVHSFNQVILNIYQRAVQGLPLRTNIYSFNHNLIYSCINFTLTHSWLTTESHINQIILDSFTFLELHTQP